MIDYSFFNSFLLIYLVWKVFRLQATVTAQFQAINIAGDMLGTLMDHLKVPMRCECVVCETKPLTRQEYSKENDEAWKEWERSE